MTTTINPESIIRIVNKHKGRRGELIAILEDIQAEHNYLPREALRLVALRTSHSLVDIYGVATFYRSFSLKPRGRHLVSVCLGTACHVRGAPRVLDEVQRALGVKAGQTTDDRMFTVNTVNCLGACALGPVAVIDGEYHRNVSSAEVRPILERQRAASEAQRIADDERIFRVNVSCPRCNRSLITNEHTLDGNPMVHVTVSFGRKHGWLRMSSLYGDQRYESEHEIPAATVAHFFCPRCHAELRSTKICPACDAPMIPLLVRAGGMIHFCARRGCKEHHLDLSD